MKIESTDIGILYVPEPIRFSFETPGWYLLGSLLFLFIIFFLFKRLKHYRGNAYRREALKKIALIEDHQNKQQDILYINSILIVLKAVAIRSYGRQQVAPLYGDDWLLFLESKGENTPFTQYKNSIINALYKTVLIDIQESTKIVELSKKWIKTHA